MKTNWPNTSGHGFRRAVHRIASLVALLRQSPDGITANEIASQYECSAKSVYRDVALLREMGFDVHSQNDGWPIRGYSLAHDTHRCPICDAATTILNNQRTGYMSSRSGCRAASGPVRPMEVPESGHKRSAGGQAQLPQPPSLSKN